MENAIDNGVFLRLGEKVISIAKEGSGFLVTTDYGNYRAKVVIDAAGTAAEEVARMVDPDLGWRLIPRKGEYFVLDHFGGGFVRHVLFPLPSEKGKGRRRASITWPARRAKSRKIPMMPRPTPSPSKR